MQALISRIPSFHPASSATSTVKKREKLCINDNAMQSHSESDHIIVCLHTHLASCSWEKIGLTCVRIRLNHSCGVLFLGNLALTFLQTLDLNRDLCTCKTNILWIQFSFSHLFCFCFGLPSRQSILGGNQEILIVPLC